MYEAMLGNELCGLFTGRCEVIMNGYSMTHDLPLCPTETSCRWYIQILGFDRMPIASSKTDVARLCTNQ